MVPVTPAEFVEHPLSADAVADAVTVTVAGETAVALIAANRASASLARLASTPVPAANPITAADRIAIMRDKINTKTEHPRIRFRAVPFSDGG